MALPLKEYRYRCSYTCRELAKYFCLILHAQKNDNDTYKNREIARGLLISQKVLDITKGSKEEGINDEFYTKNKFNNVDVIYKLVSPVFKKKHLELDITYCKHFCNYVPSMIDCLLGKIEINDYLTSALGKFEIAKIGTFSDFSIKVYSLEENFYPHFHLQTKDGNESCIRLDSADYIKHEKEPYLLNSNEIKKLIKFLNMPYHKNDIGGEYSNFIRTVHLWMLINHRASKMNYMRAKIPYYMDLLNKI